MNTIRKNVYWAMDQVDKQLPGDGRTNYSVCFLNLYLDIEDVLLRLASDIDAKKANMTFNQQALKAVHALCTEREDDRTCRGVMEGMTVVSWYRGNGNYDISIDGRYMGTVWYS